MAWPVAAIMATTQEDTEILSVGGTQQLHWWGYGLEIQLQAIYKDIEDPQHEIEVDGESILKVIVEGRRPNYYFCGEKVK